MSSIFGSFSVGASCCVLRTFSVVQIYYTDSTAVGIIKTQLRWQTHLSWKILLVHIYTIIPKDSMWLPCKVTNHLDFFQTVLILSFLYGIKWTLIPDGKSREMPQLEEFLIYITIIVCKIQHLNTRPLLSVLCCFVKYNVCHLCLYPVFSNANQIVRIIMGLYRRRSLKKTW
jgi:hypothetical protein